MSPPTKVVEVFSKKSLLNCVYAYSKKDSSPLKNSILFVANHKPIFFGRKNKTERLLCGGDLNLKTKTQVLNDSQPNLH